MQFGFSVFEGIRCYSTDQGPAVFRMNEHVDRLFDSAHIVGFRELPVQLGDTGDDAVTRRVLLVGTNSLAPNTVVLDVDADREVMVVHQLVANQGRAE